MVKFKVMKKLVFIFMAMLFSNVAYSQTLLIFGGADHDVYLGKLNASEYDSESIWNEYCKYGNEYNSNSIWNEYGKYGSEHSNYSPFNEYASNPPVIVDKQGNFYGYFTVNKFKSKRANFDLVNIIYEYYEEIREDVREWSTLINVSYWMPIPKLPE